MVDKYKQLYDRMIKLWGFITEEQFVETLEEEGFHDLHTRVGITEELEYRIYQQKQLKNKWKKEVK